MSTLEIQLTFWKCKSLKHWDEFEVIGDNNSWKYCLPDAINFATAEALLRILLINLIVTCDNFVEVQMLDMIMV